ncbi:hypothetical protein GQ54DRAFT_296252, partial [Martensiomyces pterosporus]
MYVGETILVCLALLAISMGRGAVATVALGPTFSSDSARNKNTAWLLGGCGKRTRFSG